MILDSRDIPAKTELKCDVVIVGAGAGGVTVARELLDSSLDVILLESGGRAEEKETQDLYSGEVLDPVHHSALHRHRRRRFGGTTTVWGGRCAPLDKIDFEARSFVPYSGWPVSRDDMDEYFRRAHEHCECGAYTYEVAEALPDGQHPLIPGFQSADFTQERIWRFSLPTDFGKRCRPAFEASPGIRVYLHANCLGIQTNNEGQQITGLRVASLKQNEFVVRAKYYIIAAGCLETTRLLLVSRDVWPEGIGNQKGLVGRFYSGHFTGDLCTATFTPKGGEVIWNYERSHEGVYCRRSITICEETQRRERLMNFRVTLTHPPIPDVAHRNAILSAAYLTKRLLIDKIPPEYNKVFAETKYREVREHLRNIVFDAPNLAGFSIHWLRRRILARRKLPSIAFKSPDNVYSLHFDAEQSPNPDSRVMLGEERDLFGLPRLRVDWRGSDRDVESVLACFTLLKKSFEASGVGKMNAPEEVVAERLQRQAGVGAHQFGTTRMAGDPSHGVVDANCKVHGTQNLFISTSSVFPTVGYANPVLTITAFAIRLADHLKSLSRATIQELSTSKSA